MDGRVTSLFAVSGHEDASGQPDPGFERLLEFVRETRAFDYRGYRRPSLMRRFQKRLHATGASSWPEYQAYLRAHPEEYAELFDATLINVTGFFRDAATWEAVAAGVIPLLLERRPGASPIRVWSAGCASGEEPYTIAMLLAEALGEGEARRRVEIWATDADGQALAQAREAVYGGRQLEKVPPELRARYFEPRDGGFAVRAGLRSLVTFDRNDLQCDPPVPNVDLLVSRNTLVYFNPEMQRRILRNFHAVLGDGGFLVAGSEALPATPRLFVPHDLAHGIFRKPPTPSCGTPSSHSNRDADDVELDGLVSADRTG